MPRFRTLDELDVAGKRVLLRADLNVPIKDGKVTDATRIERLAPTIEALLAKNARVVVMSPRPGSAVAEIAIDLARPRRPTDLAVVELRERALKALGVER